jgi:hypothetical protein
VTPVFRNAYFCHQVTVFILVAFLVACTSFEYVAGALNTAGTFSVRTALVILFGARRCLTTGPE